MIPLQKCVEMGFIVGQTPLSIPKAAMKAFVQECFACMNTFIGNTIPAHTPMVKDPLSFNTSNNATRISPDLVSSQARGRLFPRVKVA